MNIGLYGGTFSPPHNAHVRAARLFVNAAELDILYVMPSGIPPHKSADKGANKEDRLEMSRLAFENMATVSDFEISREGKSFTVETLRYLRTIHPDDVICMLMGEDMLVSLESWYCPEEIMSIARIYAMSRNSDGFERISRKAEEYKEKYGADIRVMCDTAMVLSSTQIREMVRAGMDITSVVPEAVAGYIKERKLYEND